MGGLEGCCLFLRERAKNDDVEEGNVAVSCSAGDGPDASDSQCIGLLPRWRRLGIGHPTPLTETRDGKTSYAQRKHYDRALRSLKQKARFRKESSLCFDSETRVVNIS